MAKATFFCFTTCHTPATFANTFHANDAPEKLIAQRSFNRWHLILERMAGAECRSMYRLMLQYVENGSTVRRMTFQSAARYLKGALQKGHHDDSIHCQ